MLMWFAHALYGQKVYIKHLITTAKQLKTRYYQ